MFVLLLYTGWDYPSAGPFSNRYAYINCISHV